MPKVDTLYYLQNVHKFHLLAHSATDVIHRDALVVHVILDNIKQKF